MRIRINHLSAWREGKWQTHVSVSYGKELLWRRKALLLNSLALVAVDVLRTLGRGKPCLQTRTRCHALWVR